MKQLEAMTKTELIAEVERLRARRPVGVREVAAMMGRAYETARSLAAHGGLPPTQQPRIGGAPWWWDDEMGEFIAARPGQNPHKAACVRWHGTDCWSDGKCSKA